MSTNTVGSQPNVNAWGTGLRTGLSSTEKELVKTTLQAAADLTSLATTQLEQLTKAAGTTPAASSTPAAGADPHTSMWGGQCKSLDDVFNMAVNGAPGRPSTGDSSHPSGSLKSDPNSGVITTPGGYKIEATKQHEWKITGPDGKETRVWGDPHVDEGDGGKWDFKRDSTFVLGDGTRINCSTTPFGNGMTVTKGLEIISGNDRVEITGIDKGKGKTGQITQDGYAHANSFGGKDVFVMGKETDDWSFTGKEVIGSNNGGESFKLGKDLAAGNTPGSGTQPNVRLDQLLNVFKNLAKVFDSLKDLTNLLTRRSNQNTGIVPPGREPIVNRRRGFLERSFAQIGRMMDTVMKMQNLARSVDTNRNRYLA